MTKQEKYLRSMDQYRLDKLCKAFLKDYYKKIEEHPEKKEEFRKIGEEIISKRKAEKKEFGRLNILQLDEELTYPYIIETHIDI